MTDELKVITIKMPASELDALQNYLTDNDLDNRSEVIRKAIKLYITGAKEKTEDEKNGVFVHLNPVLMSAFDNLVDSGMTNDAEAYIRTLVEKDLIPENVREEMKEMAFKKALTTIGNRRRDTGQPSQKGWEPLTSESKGWDGMNMDTVTTNDCKIAVVCIGGAGITIGRVLSERAVPAEIVAVNTDLNSLRSATAERIFALTDNAHVSSIDDVTSITDSLGEEFRLFIRQFSHVCIVSAMGGRTGTGATAVIAKICSEEKILFSSFIVMPFSFEGRSSIAESGLEALRVNCTEPVNVFANEDMSKKLGANAQFDEIMGAANNRVADAVMGTLKTISPVNSFRRINRFDSVLVGGTRSIATI